MNKNQKKFNFYKETRPSHLLGKPHQPHTKNLPINAKKLWDSVFELDKQNQFAKNSERSKEKGPKNFLDLRIILWKMRRVLTKFCELIWTNMYDGSL